MPSVFYKKPRMVFALKLTNQTYLIPIIEGCFDEDF